MRRLPILLLLAAACAPDNRAPVDVVVLTFQPDSKGGHYEPRQVKLKTVSDLVTMEGTVAKFVSGAKIAIDDNDPAVQAAGNDVDKFIEAITKNAGGPVKVGWIDKGGALVPADFHSLNIATAYYNLERATDLYARLGSPLPDKFGQRLVYYFPDFSEGGKADKDNAAFMPLLQSFLVFPFEELQMVPLSINGGVMAHEFTHAVFNFKIHNASRVPIVPSYWFTDAETNAGLNLLDSLDEGLADLFGTATTCDDSFANCAPTFVAKSLPGDEAALRRLDVTHCYDDALKQDLLSMPNSTFTGPGVGEQYRVGSVLSSALWKASSDDAVVALAGDVEARKKMLRAVYKALACDDGTRKGLRELVNEVDAAAQANFKLDSAGIPQGVLDTFIVAADDVELKTAMCAAFMDQFNLSITDLKKCPAGTQRYTNCASAP